jgi:hypothetical protein
MPFVGSPEPSLPYALKRNTPRKKAKTIRIAGDVFRQNLRRR